MNLTPTAVIALAVAALVGIWRNGAMRWAQRSLWRAIVALVALGLAYELFVTRRLIVAARWSGAPRLYLGRSESLRLEIDNGSLRDIELEFAPVWPAGLRRRRGGAGRQRARGLRAVDRARRASRGAWGGAVAAAADARARAVEAGAVVTRGRARGPCVSCPTRSARAVRASARPRAGRRRCKRSVPAASCIICATYRPGDPRHTIDWKATARSSRLITRVFSEDQHLEVMLLSTPAARAERSSTACSSSATTRTSRRALPSIALRAMISSVSSHSRTGRSRRSAPARGRRPSRASARARELAPQPVESDVLTAALHVRNLVRHRCLVVIMTDLYERSETSQLVQSARLLVPKHLPMIVGHRGPTRSTSSRSGARPIGSIPTAASPRASSTAGRRERRAACPARRARAHGAAARARPQSARQLSPAARAAPNLTAVGRGSRRSLGLRSARCERPARCGIAQGSVRMADAQIVPQFRGRGRALRDEHHRRSGHRQHQYLLRQSQRRVVVDDEAETRDADQ